MFNPTSNVIEHRVGKTGNVANRKNIVTGRAVNPQRAHGVVGEHAVTQVKTGAFEPFGVRVRPDCLNKNIAGEFFSRVEQHAGYCAFAEQVGDRGLHFEANTLGLVTTLKLAS